MDKVDLKLLQDIEKEMLSSLAEIFEKNGIDYCLAYGTALGCVRHNGFIPWDDDLDLYINGSDYFRLREVFLSSDTGDLSFHDYSTVKGYPYVFPKIVNTGTFLKEKRYEHLDYCGGVYIDVFPLFSIPNGAIRRRIFEARRYFRYALLRAYYTSEDDVSGVRKIASLFAKKTIHPDSVQERLARTYLKGVCHDSIVAEPNVFKYKSFVDSKHFESFAVGQFEGHERPIPSSPEDYLTVVYGDYMKLPEPCRRVPTHSFSFLSLRKDEG